MICSLWKIKVSWKKNISNILLGLYKATDIISWLCMQVAESHCSLNMHGWYNEEHDEHGPQTMSEQEIMVTFV